MGKCRSLKTVDSEGTDQGLVIEKARLSDIPVLHELIEEAAREGLVLQRSLGHLYDHVRDFWVARCEGQLLSCSSLHICWEDLAEVKSLVVRTEARRNGIGTQMVQACIDEAQTLGLRRVFVLTYLPRLFERLGFRRVDKAALPHKVWQECIHCPKFPHCEEIAMVVRLPEGEAPAV